MAELPPAIARSGLPDRAKLVAGELWRCVQAQDARAALEGAGEAWAWPSRATLGERLGYSEATVKRALRDLRAAGLIERASRVIEGRAVEVWLLRGGQDCTPEGSAATRVRTAPGGQLSTPRGVSADPQNQEENQEKNQSASQPAGMGSTPSDLGRLARRLVQLGVELSATATRAPDGKARSFHGVEDPLPVLLALRDSGRFASIAAIGEHVEGRLRELAEAVGAGKVKGWLWSSYLWRPTDWARREAALESLRNDDEREAKLRREAEAQAERAAEAERVRRAEDTRSVDELLASNPALARFMPAKLKPEVSHG